MFDLVGQASQYPGDFLAFLVKCLVVGVKFNSEHSNKSERGAEAPHGLHEFRDRSWREVNVTFNTKSEKVSEAFKLI